MLFKTGPERNIITSPQKRYFFGTKEQNLRIIENARLNLLFVPTLHDGYFNKLRRFLQLRNFKSHIKTVGIIQDLCFLNLEVKPCKDF